MEIRRYALLLWRWAWLLVLGALLGGGGALGASLMTDPTYSASTTLLINQAPVSKASDYNSLLSNELLAKTYAELLRKRPVMDQVIANLKLNTTADDLANVIQVSVVRDTQLIALSVRDGNPQRAADITNEIVRVFSQQNHDLQSERYANSIQSLQDQMAVLQADIDKTQSSIDALNSAQSSEKDRLQRTLNQYRDNYAALLKNLGDVRLAETQTADTVSVVEAATVPSRPSSPRTLLNAVLGAVVGLMLALGLAFLVEYLDDTVKSGGQVQQLVDLSTLATIAQIGGKEAHQKLVTIADPRAPIAEAYRMLRVNVDFASIDRPARTILVTSSGPGEGKSTTVANLAVAIAQSGKRVVLVDADLRRPTVQKIFRVSPDRGLTTALLQAGSSPDEHLTRVGVRNLAVMPSGPLPPNPSELLGSQRMAELIAQLAQQADVVLLDSPPVLAVADAAILARACDATLLVVMAKKTRSEALRRAREQLAQSGARVIGAVLNRAAIGRGSSAYSYYYYYGDGKRDKRLRATSLPLMQKAGDGAGQAAELSEMVEIGSNGDAIAAHANNGAHKLEV